MNRRRMIDLSIACICASIVLIAGIYGEGDDIQEKVIIICSIVAVLFLLLAYFDNNRKMVTKYKQSMTDKNAITELVLLSEEETELMIWDMYGKSALVIGRDVNKNDVDVDLSKSPYASMVDAEHAVLNFSGENWYIEDLGSRNGISLKKVQDNRTYRLSQDTPCLIEQGDLICVGLNKLLLR